jgi:hypothetical protein
MISDTLSDAVAEIDQYLNDPLRLATYPEPLRAEIVALRNAMDALRDRLDVRSVTGQLPPLPVAVTARDGSVLYRCGTLREAESFVAGLAHALPDAVARGDYGIDAPEEMVNPPQRGRGGSGDPREGRLST